MSEYVFKKIEKREKVLHFNSDFINSLKNPSNMVRDHLKLAEKIIKENKKIIYISGALTHVPENEKELYLKTKKIVDDLGSFGYAPHLYGDPLKFPGITPKDIRDVDFLWAAAISDGSVFWLNHLSFGVGIEMAWAEMYNVPSIKIASKDVKVSRLARGMYDNAKIIQYDKVEEGLEELEKEISKILNPNF